MKLSDLPANNPVAFGESAGASYIRPIPRTTADPAAASFTNGFPPQTFTDENAGGTPPDGRDVNGMFNFLSLWSRWQATGGAVRYDSVYQGLIGGYPAGAIIMSSVKVGLFFISLVDDNTTNPDSVSSANWGIAFDCILQQNLAVNNGYTVWASGKKEFWGRVDIPSGQSVRVIMPITTSFIIPTVLADIVIPGPSNMQIGGQPVGPNFFDLFNYAPVTQTVNWRAIGV